MKRTNSDSFEIQHIFGLLSSLNVPCKEQNILFQIAVKTMDVKEFINMLSQLTKLYERKEFPLIR